MLELRRIIDYSSRVHTYLVCVYSFFALLFVLFLYFPVDEVLVEGVTTLQMVLGWTIFLEGIWIIFGSILCTLYSKVIVVKPILTSIVRFGIYFVVSALLDIVNSIITGGFSYGS